MQRQQDKVKMRFGVWCSRKEALWLKRQAKAFGSGTMRHFIYAKLFGDRPK